jgi:AraC-like DNA-binding protein
MYRLSRPHQAMPGGRIITGQDEQCGYHRQLLAAGILDADEESFLDGRVVRLFPKGAGAGGRVDFVTLSEDAFLILNDAVFPENFIAKFRDEKWTRFHFRLDAETTVLFDRLGEAELKGPLCSIMHLPEGMVEAEWYRGRPRGWVTLCCSRRYLLQLLDESDGGFPRLLERYLQGGDPEWIFDVFPLSAPMARCLHDIPQIPYTTLLGQIHLEAKIVEMMCMFLYCMNGGTASRNLPVLLRPQDVDQIHEARRILEGSLAHPPSVAELSRRVGLNRKKLTYGFKHLFRQTLSGYILQQRMLAARRLLEEGELPIEHIASMLGYEHAANFSTAFRRYFGIAPRSARR